MKEKTPSLTKHIIPFFIVIIILVSCEKDKPTPSWNTDILIPLISDSIVVADVLDERFFVENADQSLSLVFNDDLFEMNIDSLVSLPDTLFHYGLRLSFLPDSANHMPGDTIITQQLFLPIDIQYGDDYTLQLEKAILETGNIVFEVFQESEVDLLVVLGIEGAEHPETGSFFSTAKVNNNELYQHQYDLSDYHLNLSGPNMDTINMFTYNVALIVHPDEPNEVTVFPEDSVAMTIYFKDISLKYSRGYFGQNTFRFGPEIFDINLFDDIDAQGISFDDAEINFAIKNTYGVDVNFKIEDIIATNTSSGESAMLEGQLVGSELYVDRANEVVEESGEIEAHQVNFDFSNSNFSELFSIKPDQISYEMSLETNVNADSSKFDNFFWIDQPITAIIDARVNGGVNIDSLFESSRISWNGGGVDLENIDEGELKLIFTNAFPFDFTMNLFFEDEENNIIDTLVFNEFIAGGNLNENHFVASPKITQVNIPLDESLKSNFKNSKYTMYELMISSANGEQVMIHKNDYLKFKVIGDFKYLLEQ